MSIFNTIKFKFMAGVFSLIIVIIAFLVALSYEHEKKAIEKRVYAQLNATADLKKELVVNYINERISGLKALSSARDMIESLSFTLNDKTGVSKTGHLIHIYQHLEAFQKTYPDYLSIDVTDFNGNVIVSTGHHPHGPGKHTHKHEHKEGISKHIDIIKQGEAVVMQEYLDSEERHLDVALGIRDRSGNIKAVIVSSILLNNTLFPIFNDYTGLGVTGETLLIRLSGDSITYINPTRYPLRKKAVDVSYCKDYFRLCMNAVSGNEGIGEGLDYRERKIIGAYRYIPALGWGLVTKIDIDEAFKEITALRKEIFVLGALILVITLAVSYFVVSMFTSPIISLAQKTKAIASGDYSIRIESRRKNEIGELERDFDEMVSVLDYSRKEVAQKQLELEQSNFQLDRKVKERTQELTDANTALLKALENIKKETAEKKKLEEMLFQSQKMEAIGQLAGGVAHDFNNILTAIIGFGGLMQMNMKEDDPNKTHLKEILTAAERAAHLTHGLLAFSRKQIMNPKAVNINGIMRNMEKLLKRIITEDIDMKTLLAGRNINIMADAGQIEQVLMNLTTNARDAMSHGGILTISSELIRLDDEFIKTHGYGEPGEYALISVSDTGMGMDEETKDRIFEPFFTTKDFGKGTGLGLAIVYGIIKQHNGYINCYSEQDKGTTFKIYLPVIGSGITETEETTAAKPKGGTETVLVADDDTPIRMLIKEVLRGSGYTVIEAADGNEAVSRFIENRDAIRLLLLDVVMPQKNGREAYEEIRAVMPDIKVIFMSGYTADIIHDKGIIEEGINFISKPVSPQTMLRKVREALDR